MRLGDLKIAALHFHEKWQLELVVDEDGANKSELVNDFRRERLLEFKELGVTRSKEKRISIADNWLETGKLNFLPVLRISTTSVARYWLFLKVDLMTMLIQSDNSSKG